MKISLSWVFDHIDTGAEFVSPDLIERFNQTTAEIEKFQKISIDLDRLAIAQVKSVQLDQIKVFCAEWNDEYTLPLRDDAFIGSHFLITKLTDSVQWARGYDLGGDKEFFIPLIAADQTTVAGGWRKKFDVHDYILEVDNKSITNRPDLWGHRGFAREIAAILNLPMVPLEKFLAQNKIIEFEKKAPANESPFSIEIQVPKECSRFAGLFIEKANPLGCSILIASRLARVDSKPINAMVDITNYVMLDLGHPMHGFDAATLKNKEIIVRKAYKDEKLTVLDGEELTLCTQDIVIADGKKAISLAGVIGGSETGITAHTSSLFLEAACFDATTIRCSATRHKKRTDASARFEKSLDQQQATHALLRCVKLLQTFGVINASDQPIISVGLNPLPIHIELTHDFIEQRLGVTLKPDFVVNTLRKLSFKVDQTGVSDGIDYIVTVPTFRATKDITIKEDIVEEIGRFYGYHNIQLSMPSLQLKPSDLKPTYRLRKIKNLMAYALAMREVYTYSFFDEDFLRILGWQPADALAAQSPVSQNWQRLITTIMPNLFKAVHTNVAHHDQLRFFEWGRMWQKEMHEVTEKKVLGGILFDQKNEVDFYDGKAAVNAIFDSLAITVHWDKVDVPKDPWFQPYQTAYLIYDGNIVGIAGKIETLFLNKVEQGSAFGFELDGDFLLDIRPKLKRFKPLAKYPEVERDISMLIGLGHTVDDLTRVIQRIDERIVRVTLVDFFQKPEWDNKKSLTFRFVLRDDQKTMTKQEVDVIWDQIVAALINRGATIR